MRGIQKSDLKVIPCKQEYQMSMTISTKNSMALFSLKKMNSFILRIRNIKFCWCLGRIKTTKVLKVHELICQEVDGSSCTFIKWIQSMKYLKKILVIAKKRGRKYVKSSWILLSSIWNLFLYIQSWKYFKKITSLRVETFTKYTLALFLISHDLYVDWTNMVSVFAIQFYVSEKVLMVQVHLFRIFANYNSCNR